MPMVKVLLIDDSEPFRDVVRELLATLEGTEYDLEWAGTYKDGQQALLEKPFDVCLLDYILDERNGLELLREAVREGCRTPIIMLTGQGGQEIDVEAIQAGAFDYLDKVELRASLLERSIRHSMERHRAQQALQQAYADLEKRVQERTLELSRTIEALNGQIAERERAEQALRESEERFRNLMEYIPGVAIQGYHTDGMVFYWNKASEEVYGYRTEEAIGRNLGDLIIPQELRPLFEKGLELGAEARWSGEFMPGGEYTLRRKDGSPVPVRSIHTAVCLQGREPLLFCIDVDLTERKEAEEAIHRLAAAVEQVEDIIIITDSGGTIQYVNPAFERVTGYSRQEALGKNPRLLKSGEHDDAFYRELWETIKGGLVWRGQFTNRRKNGSLYREDATISPVFGASGGIVNFVAVKRDVTKEVELKQQLFQAQKLESVGRLAGGIAHDFGNLLSPILGYAEMALTGLSPREPAYDHVRQIHNAGHRACNLVRQLLAFGRKQVLDMRTLDVNEVVSGFLNMLRHLIGEDIEVALYLDPELGSVKADRAQLEQVLMNLAVNARDAMPRGGTLTIETSNAVLEGSYVRAHEDIKPGPYVLLAVSDTGHGMDAETLGQMFVPFFTTKEPDRGTGLGLSTVYGIVKQHKGHIQPYSELGRGTTFKIYLPRVDEPAELGEWRQAGQPGVRGAETVLVVEDDDMVRKLARDILLAHGYTVLDAGTPEEALDSARGHPGVIALLVADVVMPRMNGPELYQRLSAIRPDLKVLYMSGYTGNVIVHHTFLDEGVPFLEKPFTVQTLTEKVREALES